MFTIRGGQVRDLAIRKETREIESSDPAGVFRCIISSPPNFRNGYQDDQNSRIVSASVSINRASNGGLMSNLCPARFDPATMPSQNRKVCFDESTGLLTRLQRPCSHRPNVRSCERLPSSPACFIRVIGRRAILP